MIATTTNNRVSGTEISLRMMGISKQFGPVKALADVSFTVRQGTVHALVGENGAGKSTLMKILAGVYQPDRGTIEINGKAQKLSKPAEALAAGISMIYQELDLAEHLTVAENVFLGMELSGRLPFIMDHKKMIGQTAEIAQRFNFKIDPTAVVEELAMGDCQIIEILKALMRKATIIVMDEPTSSLSETEATMLFKLVKALRRQGLSIIYISHRLEEIVGLADDVSVLRDGQMVHSGSMAELDIPKIVHLMVGRELKDFFPARAVNIGPTCVKVRNLSSQNGVEDISFDIRRLIFKRKIKINKQTGKV